MAMLAGPGRCLFVPILLDGKTDAKTCIIDSAAQERSFACGVSRHVVAIRSRKFQLQRFVGARYLEMLDQPVAKRQLILDRPRLADGQVQMEGRTCAFRLPPKETPPGENCIDLPIPAIAKR